MRSSGRLGRAQEKRPSGAMNKTEAAYASYLEGLRLGGELLRWEFEAIRLRIAPQTTITIDFWLVNSDGTMELHDVKGTKKLQDGREVALCPDAEKVKMKTAAAMYPEFRVCLVWKTRAEGWKIHELPVG